VASNMESTSVGRSLQRPSWLMLSLATLSQRGQDRYVSPRGQTEGADGKTQTGLEQQTMRKSLTWSPTKVQTSTHTSSVHFSREGT
jgi:hypothetical protein